MPFIGLGFLAEFGSVKIHNIHRLSGIRYIFAEFRIYFIVSGIYVPI